MIVLAVSAIAVLPLNAADFREAEKLFRAGQYAECIAQTDEGVKEPYRAEDWWLLRMECEAAQGQYEAAFASYQSGVDRATESIRLRWAARPVARHIGQPELADQLFEDIGERIRGQAWRYRVSGLDLVIVGRYLLESGFDPKTILDGPFASAKRTSSGRIAALIASGVLALAKEDFALAAEYFEEANLLDAENPDIKLGLAQAFASSDGERTQAELTAALMLNPNHVPTLLLVAGQQIDRELYDTANDTLAAVLKVNPVDAQAWSQKAVLAHLDADAKLEAECVTKALSTWSTNPEVPHLIGSKLARKYRFAESAEYQRQALEFDPDFVPAKLQLAQDLLRLGDEPEGWALAAAVSEVDPYNVLAYNLATLRDRLTQYTVLEQGRYRVRMDPVEASIYGPRVLRLLQAVGDEMAAKYAVELPPTVSVEIFSKQSDFAIRTFGLPGGAGFLGVCFGPVVTMNSPAALGPTASNWESVLWHEFVHVVTLTKTRNKMPRWLSEGISVYEERQRDPRWGQQMDPTFRQMILTGELTPVSQLSSAFLSPPTPMHLQFAYYESSLVVEFIVEEFGHEALLNVLSDLGEGVAINDALSRHTVDQTDLDAAFDGYAKRQAESYASAADFAKVELPERVDDEAIAKLLEATPNSVPLLERLLASEMRAGNWAEAMGTLDRITRLFGESPVPVDLLARKAMIQGRLGQRAERVDTLKQLVSRSADQVDALSELLTDAQAAGDLDAARDYADQLLAIDPLKEQPHEVLASVAAATGDRPLAIDALEAISAMGPSDPADLHYRLAKLCHEESRLVEARRHVLLALEEAPRYADAHRLLRELIAARDNGVEETSSTLRDKAETEEVVE